MSLAWKAPGGFPPRNTERDAAICALHQAGATVRELAGRFAISQARVCQIIRTARRRER